ncbi:hypothetical protein BSQ39_06090 [Loigolactobacillus backii]|uniref:hypothetical protein n=1 Tax=Loigolactobacillus backii TaxID=375175 RepID=UPI000C1CA95C|nr:hypothetical protein [Loigolactobacillus backii]PIO83177.1 hypothetical protein BSQ39_06090 [Loigolactobacillus backii]
MQKIAGTIMVFDGLGAPEFLVTKDHEDQFKLLLTDFDERKTPLANILEALKTKLKVDVSDLRLSELSNVEVDQKKLSLFIFEWGKISTKTMDHYAEVFQTQGYQFRAPRELRGLLKQIDIRGVPYFNKKG